MTMCGPVDIVDLPHLIRMFLHQTINVGVDVETCRALAIKIINAKSNKHWCFRILIGVL